MVLLITKSINSVLPYKLLWLLLVHHKKFKFNQTCFRLLKLLNLSILLRLIRLIRVATKIKPQLRLDFYQELKYTRDKKLSTSTIILPQTILNALL